MVGDGEKLQALRTDRPCVACRFSDLRVTFVPAATIGKIFGADQITSNTTDYYLQFF